MHDDTIAAVAADGGQDRRVQASPRDMLPWQPGDVVLSANRFIYVRADEGWTGGGRWLWSTGVEFVPAEAPYGPEGGSADDEVERPLTLLIRGGRPLGGVVIDDRMVQGALVRDELPSPGNQPEIASTPGSGSGCPSVYPNALPATSAACESAAPPGPAAVHYNRAGFGWIAQEAAESASRVTGSKDPDR